MTWEKRAPGVWIKPVNVDLEMELQRLAGPQRKKESVGDHLQRIGRIRQLLRCEEAMERVEILANDWKAEAEASLVWPHITRTDVAASALLEAMYGPREES